ncbi:MAG: GWxTD domain-containing protein, partial [candidate division Zixibacteria bacterium]
DVSSKKAGSVFYSSIEVALSDPDRLTIGGERLAYQITPVSRSGAGSNPHMAKNDLEVLTNPVGLVSTLDSSLSVYAEVYNLIETEEFDQFLVSYKVLDATGHTYYDFGQGRRSKPGKTAVLAQTFDISGWPPGIFNLSVIVTDPATNSADTANLPFRIMSPAELRPKFAQYIEISDPYDSLVFEDRMRLVTYLLTPAMELTLKGLTQSGQENFLNQYWKEHDSIPSTNFNETRAETIRRYTFVSERFSTSKEQLDGWKSDRGRIYMTWGEADELEDIQAPTTGSPIQVWHYRRFQGGLIFVFVDEHFAHDYRLVHSNAKGEYYSQKWKEIIQSEALIDLE